MYILQICILFRFQMYYTDNQYCTIWYKFYQMIKGKITIKYNLNQSSTTLQQQIVYSCMIYQHCKDVDCCMKLVINGIIARVWFADEGLCRV